MQSIEDIRLQAAEQISRAATTADLQALERSFVGKSGALTALMRQLGSLPAEERPAFGKRVNDTRGELETMIAERARELRGHELAAQFELERIDVTLPGRPPKVGREHVLQQATNSIKQILFGLGFEYVESPELELFKYNFEALNYPESHPAMDEQDTFYVTDQVLLRTQATAFQGRIFETCKPPFRKFTIGRTYRNEAVDRTHSHTFHQVDAFMVDRGVSMAHLKGTLGAFARALFGKDVRVRFRPDFFPFVEPGVDYAISTPKLFGGRWVELGGAGLVHANILESYGIDPLEYSGWAFGLGVERIPMMAHGVDDLRHFLENDLRFLEQFA